jgi:hypothetical protein
MTTGMLWIDTSNRPLSEKIAKAAAYHLQKYGRAPDLCLVNPSTQIDNPEVKGANGSAITVRPFKSVLPGHLWIGVEEMPTDDEVAK